MRIAKITLDGYFNYGGVLQNYALQQVLRRYTEQVDSVWHTANDFLPCTWKWRWQDKVKLIINWHGFEQGMVRIFGWEMVRQAAIRRFCQKYINEKFLEGKISSVSEDYDYFVTGSDQVWNPFFSQTRCKDEFLTFAPREKRTSYAASIGLSAIPEQDKENFKRWLNEMKYISVREQRGAVLVKELTGRTVPVHVDPTLLLTADEWSKIEEKPVWYTGKGEDYICTYFMGANKISVAEIAKKNKLKVINILDQKKFDHFIISPQEFIWLIHHAALVYTDSFHGTAFSINFGRAFIVCERIENKMCNMSSRIDTLLELFGLQSRLGTKDNGYCSESLFDIDYSDTVSIMERERKRSFEYLLQALEGLQK